MQSDDVHLNVDAIEIETGAIEKQASTSQYDQTHKLTSFEDFCQVTRTQLLGKLNEHHDEEHTKYQKNAVIQRVPKVLQRNKDFSKYYEPMELSVGPLHAANPYLFKAELKIKLAERYLKISGHKAEDLFEEIMNNLQELRTFFDHEEIKSYDDEMLARLLFLDGCAVLQFMHSFFSSLNEFSINNGQAELIQQDLFLFENQIPFKVLQLLMGMKSQKSQTKSGENEYRIAALRFLLNNNLIEIRDHSRYRNFKNLIYGDSKRKPVLHLLDFLRSLLVMESPGHERRFCISLLLSFCESLCTFCCAWLVCLPFCFSEALDSFIDYIVSCFDEDWYKQQSFRNVQELTAAGITLKPIHSCSLKDIAFHKRWFFRGRVELPSLLVDSSTARKMLNMVAYEMCSPNDKHNWYVTSYINLIDLLIDDEKDVKLLRSADILRNRLSTDTEVATLFNKIGSTCLSPPKDKYSDVKRDIENHYKRKLAVWMAQVYHVHFSSPWTILALLAAVTVLLLTATQTWYTIHPKK